MVIIFARLPPPVDSVLARVARKSLSTNNKFVPESTGGPSAAVGDDSVGRDKIGTDVFPILAGYARF